MRLSGFAVVLAGLLAFTAAHSAEELKAFRERAKRALYGDGAGVNGPVGPVGRAFRFVPSSPQTMNSPVVDPNTGNLYATESVGTVYCLNGKTGSLIWSYQNTDGSSMASPVVTSYGTILLGTTKGVLALFTVTGEYGWYFTDGKTTYLPATPIPDPTNPTNNAVYIAGRGNSTVGYLTAVNGGSGSNLWSQQTSGSSADALVGGGQVIVCYPGNFVLGGHVTVTAFSTLTGAQSWSVTITQQTGIYTQFMFSLGVNNNIYVGYMAAGQVAFMYKLAPGSGTVMWSFNAALSSNSYGVLGPLYLYLATEQQVSAYSLTNGNNEWTVQLGLSPLEVPIMAATGDYLYMVTGGVNTVRLSALSASTGGTIWEFKDRDAHGVFGMPIFDTAGTLYIESFSSQAGSTAYALHPATGAVLWSYSIDAGATIYYDTQLALGAGVLYLGDDTQIVGVAHASSKSNAGAIAGGVIGTLLGLALIGGGVYWYKFKRGRGYASFGTGGSAPKPLASTGYSYQSSTI